MAHRQPSLPMVQNQGARLDHHVKSSPEEAARFQEALRLHRLANDPRDRYYGLFPRYAELLAAHGQDLAPLLAQVRSDLLGSIGAESCWNWRRDLDTRRTDEAYAAFQLELIEESLAWLRADGRLHRLARGDDKQFRRLLRVVITQLLTFLEASRLPGLERLLGGATSSA